MEEEAGAAVAMARKTKIRFELNPNEQQGYEAEHVWAVPVGSGQFRILNSPFFAFGVSADDIVKAERQGQAYQFRQVIRRSGHSTYRAFLQGGRTIKHEEFKKFWHPIAARGCTFENANNRLIAIDVPPSADVNEVYKLLQEGEDAGVWAFEEANFAGESHALS